MGVDPKETSALRATTAAMKPRADIESIVSFVADAADLARPRPPAWDDVPEPMPDWDLLKQPAPDFEFDQRVPW